MREEDDPVVANEVVEVDGAVGGLGVEVGGNAAETEGCWTVGHCRWLVLLGGVGEDEVRAFDTSGSGIVICRKGSRRGN